MNDDQIQFLLIGVILLFLLCMVVTQISCFCCNRLRSSQEKVSYAKVAQPTEREKVQEEEQLSFIAKM